MNDSLALAIPLVKRFEGCRLEPYLCPAGVWTIGYGNTVLSNGDPVTDFTNPISQDEADSLLGNTLQTVQEQVKHIVKAPVSSRQEAALLSLTYNIGIGNLSSSTLLRLLNARRYKEAADQFLRWNRSRGHVLDGLTRRRKAERKLFLEGTT